MRLIPRVLFLFGIIAGYLRQDTLRAYRPAPADPSDPQTVPYRLNALRRLSTSRRHARLAPSGNSASASFLGMDGFIGESFGIRFDIRISLFRRAILPRRLRFGLSQLKSLVFGDHFCA